MHIVRFVPAQASGAPRPSAQPAIGVAEGGTVTELTGVRHLGELLRLTTGELRERCEAADGPRHDTASVRLLPPVDAHMEVWAAGVTYQRSREARVVESERAADVYELVYDAERPELFFKSTAWRVTGDGETVSIRADSGVDVPEPELGLVLNSHGEIAGYTVVNDMSSRTIEGENPLYLPQAKIYLGGCAVGPAIRPAWEIADPYALDIELTIRRDGGVAWTGRASTGQLHRRLDDLVGYLFREDVFPDGAVLATGTCLVPDLPFTLAADDEITISIAQVGTLTSTVVVGKKSLTWLAP
ncbi:2-dehydro-3-deoxy-D-arabinonate dehydratase [Thermocatellispora tengchongensis]|uniref:2-dehydro-3-deoxy-D-arabinonate dehydratase n=1 Tax=Thermocatellispora tengchongensis TaxID=1073253 RepID=A0A840NVQ2_9ACTN|nr:fumarylacetoacetate hydrolase family protein [Thermocatellispora tengchongensis]MBB5131302.1 2-dehydro-3-deoxy-D-arabinonate dehydratase [Thermocatellispora tengchongensis]